MINLGYDTAIINPTEHTKAFWLSQGHLDRVEPITEKLKIQGVALNPSSIQYFDNPSPLLQTIAIEQDLNTIELIQQPHLTIQTMAIERDLNTIKLIQEPYFNIQLLWHQKFKEQNKKDYSCLQHICIVATEIQEAALENNINNLTTIKNISVQLQYKFAQKAPGPFMFFVKNKLPKAILIAVHSHVNFLCDINLSPPGYFLLGKYNSYSDIGIDYTYFKEVFGSKYDPNNIFRLYIEERNVVDEQHALMEECNNDYYDYEDYDEDHYPTPRLYEDEAYTYRYSPDSDNMMIYNNQGDEIGHY